MCLTQLYTLSEQKNIEWESYSEGNCIGVFDFCLLCSFWVAYHLQIRHSIFILLVGGYANMGGFLCLDVIIVKMSIITI